ncbi:hypothetical protein Q8F55_000985 [Vanrija albida]|uniref:Alpha/beta hydrolase fold-3 domain-containing protein n=1 Tax=Vanrija albida TaxID=181172 RepID=A0ABR3QF04_9TREE
MAGVSPFREAPDPAAPNGTALEKVYLYVLGPLLLPTTALFYAAKYLATAAPKRTSLRQYLGLQYIRVLLTGKPLGAPESWAAASESPKAGLGNNLVYGDSLQVNTVDVITVPPISPAELVQHAALPTAAGGRVQPAERPGFVISPEAALGHGTAPAEPGEQLLLYIHGGAYVFGHPVADPFVWKAARDTGRRVFSVQYRKATSPETAWPAPLLDALAAWAYVTGTLGFPAASVHVMGCSAGGHLALALAQQLHATGAAMPGALSLLSPWVDMTMSFPSIQARDVDYLTADWLHAPVKSLARYYTPEAVRGPLFSPVLAGAGHWSWLRIPVFISVGQIEGFIDELTAFADRLTEDGVPLTLNVDPDGIHSAPSLPFMPAYHYDDFVAGLRAQFDLMKTATPASSPESTP